MVSNLAGRLDYLGVVLADHSTQRCILLQHTPDGRFVCRLHLRHVLPQGPDLRTRQEGRHHHGQPVATLVLLTLCGTCSC